MPKGNDLCDVFGCASAWTCDRPGKQGSRHCVCDKHAGIDKEDFLHNLFNGRVLVRLRKVIYHRHASRPCYGGAEAAPKGAAFFS